MLVVSALLMLTGAAAAPIAEMQEDDTPDIAAEAPAEQDDERYATLKRHLDAAEYRKITEILYSNRDAAVAEQDALWLREQSLKGQSAFINLTYSDYLWQALSDHGDAARPILATSAAMLLYTLIVFDIDGARCVDRTAPSDRSLKIMSSRGDRMQFIQSLTEEEKESVTNIVLMLDELTAEKRAEDFDAEFLCTGGMQQMMQGLLSGTVREREPREGEIGRQFEVDDGGSYVPELIEREKWDKIAAEKRAKLPETVKSFLEGSDRPDD
ncbi:MAG: hypothetical protein AAFX04_04835 [Pseudomonadota bacterium]